MITVCKNSTRIEYKSTNIMKSTLKVHNPRVIILLICII